MRCCAPSSGTFEEVDIGGDDALEAEYREWLPVVEIDGERAFVYFVDPGALRRKVAQSPALTVPQLPATTLLASWLAVSQSG